MGLVGAHAVLVPYPPEELGELLVAFALGVLYDYDDRFWLNGNYSVYPEPSEKACMDVARTSKGYFVGIYRCLDRTWSPDGGYTDLFVPLPVLNLRPA